MEKELKLGEEKFNITLKTFYGLEEVLKEELVELGYTEVKVLNRAVQIVGTWKDVYFLNLHSNTTIKIPIRSGMSWCTLQKREEARV